MRLSGVVSSTFILLIVHFFKSRVWCVIVLVDILLLGLSWLAP